MIKYIIDENECISCGTCAGVCQYDAISTDPTYAIDPDKCIGCGLCAADCVQSAISSYNDYNNVRIKIGDGTSNYGALKSLSRDLTNKEKRYVLDRVMQNVKQYFAENPQVINLKGETDNLRAAGTETSRKYFSPRTYTPLEGDNVINITDDKITSNFQYVKVGDFSWDDDSSDV